MVNPLLRLSSLIGYFYYLCCLFLFNIYLINTPNVISILLGLLAQSFNKKVLCRKVLKKQILSDKAQRNGPESQISEKVVPYPEFASELVQCRKVVTNKY